MIKELLLASALSVLSSAVRPTWNNSNYFNIENKQVVSIKNEHINDYELRIYSQDEPLTIKEGVFNLAPNLDTLMLTYHLNSIGEQTFSSNFKTINFTGSEEEFLLLGLELRSDIVIYFYACDEGFVNYWNTFVRISEDTSLCDSVTKEDYQTLLTLYKTLETDDKANVDVYRDKADATIKDSMKYLDGLYGDKESKRVEKETSPSLMITLIIIAASVGMTFIAVLYLLKDKNIIE